MKVINIIKALSVGLLLCFAVEAGAQRFSIGTNMIDWASLGTINGEAGVGVSQHFTIHVGAELNPWTLGAGSQDKQFELRHNSIWAGLRYWPWHVYSGWWYGGDARYSVYNLGGIFSRETEEGDAFGLGGYGGYSMMLSAHWNLDFGFGLWGGWRWYTKYSCPLCGVTLDKGNKPFILPDARVAFILIF